MQLRVSTECQVSALAQVASSGHSGELQMMVFWKTAMSTRRTGDSQHAFCLQGHGVPVLVYILNRPEDWEAALNLEGITAIMTDAPKALEKYLSATQY